MANSLNRHRRRSQVPKHHGCLTSKKQYQDKRCSALRERISAKQEFLNAAKKSSLASIKELRKLYVYQIMLKSQERHNQVLQVRVLNRDIPFDSLIEDAAFEALRACTSDIPLQYGNTMRVGFPAIEKLVDPKRGYEEREKLVLAQYEAEQAAGSREISALETECAETKNAKLMDLIDADRVSLGIPAKEDQKSLLHLLLRRGYIDETYQSYLSYFYEGTLSNSDWVYVMSVKKGDRLDPDYKLRNISEIIDQNLSEAEVAEQATQNIFILNHLLTQKSQLLGSVYDRLSRQEAEAVKFLTLFVKTEGLCQSALIQTAHEHWLSLWDAISQSKELSVSDINLHLSFLIRYADGELLRQIVLASDLAEYVSSRADFIRIAESIGDESLVVRFLEEVEPVFQELSHFPPASTVSRFVYEKGMYAINTRNVSLMFSSYISNSTSKDDPTLTEILAAKTSPLRNRVESELNAFVSNVLLKEDVNEREHEDTVIWLLNNGRLKQDLKLELANGKCKPLHTLADIDPDAEIYAKLLSANAICPSWENVFAYLETFCENELDDTLAAYLQLEPAAHELRRQKIDDAYVQSDTENAPNIVHAIFACRKLGRDTVNLLIESVPTDYVVEDLSTVCKEYVPIIILRRHVVYSTANYNYVKAQCRESLGAFSRETFTDLLKDIANIEVHGADLRDMLAAQKKPRDRLSLATTVLNKGSVKNLEAVADELCKMRTQDGTFMETSDHSIFCEVLVAASDPSIKIRLLIRNMQILADSQITAVLESAGAPYCDITKRGLSPLLTSPELAEGLAFQLERRGYISSFTKKDGGVRIYTFQNERKSEQVT